MHLNIALKVHFRRNNTYLTPILHGDYELTLTTDLCRRKSSEIQKFTFRPKNGDGIAKKIAIGKNNTNHCLN